MYKKSITFIKLMFTGVFALTVLLTGTGVMAVPPVLPIDPPTAPTRECEFRDESNELQLRITMGYAIALNEDGTQQTTGNGRFVPVLGGAQNPEYPRRALCGPFPPDTILRVCEFHDIAFEWFNGATPSDSFFSGSAERAILDTLGTIGVDDPPGAGTLPTGIGGLGADILEVRFFEVPETNASFPNRVFGSVATDLGEVSPITAIGNSTEGEIPISRVCLLTGPGSGSGFSQPAAVVFRTITTEDGEEICLAVDPNTTCEVKIDCVTLEPDTVGVRRVEDLLKVNHPVFGQIPVVSVSVFRQRCTSFTMDNDLPNTRYYCSGGFCFPY